MKAVTMSLLLLVLGVRASALAADSQPKKYLKGLDTVRVDISVSQALVDAGFPGAKLRTQTELQLRQAGLKVDPNSTGPNLFVEITGCRGPGTNNYACYVHVSVSDNVEVTRNQEAILTQVWGPDLWVFYIAHSLSQTMLDTTKARVDVFLNDWLAANPR
jgi:hypothetical protein